MESFIKENEKLHIGQSQMEENVIQEGIFPKTCSASRQNELRALIQSDKPFELTEGYAVHDCATVFKSFLAELHEPVLTDAHYPAHSQIAPLCNSMPTDNAIIDKKREQHILNSIQLLPQENRSLLQDIIEMLHIVASHENQNKMSSENLATLFAPHLICPRYLPPEVPKCPKSSKWRVSASKPPSNDGWPIRRNRIFDAKEMKEWERFVSVVLSLGNCHRTLHSNQRHGSLCGLVSQCQVVYYCSIAVASGNRLLLINPKVGDKLIVKKTDDLLDDGRSAQSRRNG